LGVGLPVLTCKGQAFAGRVAASLLNAAGLPELVTESMADYEAKALTLARNPTELSALKEKLKQARTSAPLFDADGFRRAIEEAFISLHK